MRAACLRSPAPVPKALEPGRAVAGPGQGRGCKPGGLRDLNVTCRYAGVFHVEKNGRYSISRTEAADLCQAFNSTLPTMAQMEKALSVGFETCRYGFIEGHVVIPRIQPNAICAANNTGVYILTSNTSQYDTYCYNASAPEKEDCESITSLTNAFEGSISITIVNRDGTRYTQKGEYRTNPDDINNNTTAEEDFTSGSSSERSTSESYIFQTHFSTPYPTEDQDSPRVSYFPEDTPDPISTTPRVFDHSTQNRNWSQWSPDFLNPEVSLQTTTRMTDMDSSHSTTLQPSADSNTGLVEDWDRTGPRPMTTQQSHTQSFSTSHGGLEEDKDQSMMSTPTSSNRHDGGGGNLPEDSATSVEGYTPHSPDTKEHTTLIPVTPANTESPGVTEVTVGDSNVNVDGHLPDEQDPSRRHPATKGPDSTGHNRDSQEGGPNTTSGPMRKPQIPEWLIILASLLALALILAVCIAVNSRRRCGQKKKLVINGNGAVEDRKPSGLNGEASKSQEMVHLVNKESSETPDQCMTADETRNLQNVDMKIGV
ncbi:CD44 antigen isoform X6 [Pipistrellus kuhlii]|uniref:CD44 antigen isoform X6 n=1 Tax=Pipistrellus kuhlii TaxID=59472 RepID=UPI001E26EAB7|nr:CD44 antigen isoform X6 [Pipistrellus kuhlii]